ncbi:HisA/HisF-related TIM barrel protein [Stigmatella hybrida]|uniref:HisA/HisF-related TIM barrel protein n=1 Tax=Stigmatella hybrida TaxID=394097 RepID=UPI001CDA5B1A|nr:HisA/HisF-related TIM barrel protein [Stigmatella hybrida]
MLRDGEQSGSEPWLVAGPMKFRSRLILGIEQYVSAELVAKVLTASGCDVFITTLDLEQTRTSLLLSDIDQFVPLERFNWIGTTSFAHSKEDALRTVRSLRRAHGIEVFKLDVRPSDNLPHNGQTLEAAKQLLDEGCAVMPFILPDLQDALALERMGCCALRIMAAPVASGRGIVDPKSLQQVIDAVSVPVIIEGGLGSPAQVAQAMEMGADAVLVNTAVAQAPDPVRMAEAMKHAVIAGRLGATQRRDAPVAAAG